MRSSGRDENAFKKVDTTGRIQKGVKSKRVVNVMDFWRAASVDAAERMRSAEVGKWN